MVKRLILGQAGSEEKTPLELADEADADTLPEVLAAAANDGTCVQVDVMDGGTKYTAVVNPSVIAYWYVDDYEQVAGRIY